MVKKWNHAGGHAVSLIGRHIHKVDIIFATTSRLGHNPGFHLFFQYFSCFLVVFHLAMRDIILGLVQRV